MANKTGSKAKKTHWVRIFRDSEGRAKVEPPYLIIGGDHEKHEFGFAAINVSVSIFFPELDITETTKDASCTKESKVRAIDIEAGKHSNKLKLTDYVTRYKEYPYQIYCKDTGEFVKTNSPPSMIIEPELP